MFTEADKQDKNSLQGITNYRDASGPWKNRPTPVPVPGKRAPWEAPYTQSRMNNTLGRGKRTEQFSTGNSTASRTVIQPRKKNQTEKTQTSQFFLSGAKKSGRSSAPDAWRTSSAIIITDNEEDVGEAVPRPPRSSTRRSSSEDPLDLFSKPGSDSRPTSSGRHSLDSAGAGPSRRGLPHDGDATKRLKLKHDQKPVQRETIDLSADDDHESIESASAFDDIQPPPPKRIAAEVKKGHVAKARLLFEPQTAGSSARPSKSTHNDEKKTLPTDSIRRVDLLKPGIKTAMRPKTTASHQPIASTSSAPPGKSESALTTSSGFVRGSKRSPRAKKSSPPPSSSSIALPLSQWARGGDLFGTEEFPGDVQYWLMYNPQKKSVDIRDETPTGHLSVSFPLGQMLHDLVYVNTSNPSSNSVIIQIDTVKTNALRLLNTKRFEQGGRTGKLVFKFVTQHANWRNGNDYDRLVKELKDIARKAGGTIDTITDKAAMALWARTVNLAAPDYWAAPQVESVAPSGSDIEIDTAPESESNRATSAILNTVGGPSTRTRAKRGDAEKGTRSPPLDPDELLLIYPPSAIGAVNITRGDVQRLEPGQYLNDNLIEFGLKLWLNDLREENPELAEQVHVFNSFFYKKIHVKNKEEGYQSVRKWTTKFDLFQKKYIVVPINEHMHWYLAIICNPEFVLKPPPPEPPKVAPQVRTRKRKRDTEIAECEEAATLSFDAPPPADDRPPSPSSTRQHSTSEAEEGTVEEMLGSFSISQDEQSHSVNIAPSSDGPLPDLQYPEGEPMDVDVDEASTKAVSSQDTAKSRDSTETETGRSSLVSDVASNVADVEMLADGDGATVLDDAGKKASGAVPASRFYSSLRKGKDKPRALLSPTPEIEVDRHSNADAEQATVDPETETAESAAESTYIFTFDSLGTKHPGAVTTLREYLKLEAKDKKGLDPSQTSSAIGKTALVPAQPNYCDCGVYLVHFVQTFMKDPVRLSEMILTKKPREYDVKARERDWNAEVVGGLRSELQDRIAALSAKWREEKAARGGQREEVEGATEKAKAETVEDSDDDIVVGEIVSRAPVKKAVGKGKAARSTEKEEAKASRLR